MNSALRAHEEEQLSQQEQGGFVMITRIFRNKLKTGLALFSSISLLLTAACCIWVPTQRVIGCFGNDGSIHYSDPIECCELRGYESCPLIIADLCFSTQRDCDAINNGHATTPCSAQPPRITSLSPPRAIIGDRFTLRINGTGLSNTSSVNFFRVAPRVPAPFIHVSNISSTDTELTAMVVIDNIFEESFYSHEVTVTTPIATSNGLHFSVNEPGTFSNTMSAQDLFSYSRSSHISVGEQSAAQSIATGSILLTPVADGTVQQLAVSGNQPGSPNITRTT